MNREQIAREVVEVMFDEGFGGDDSLEVAERIIDAILPQVTTVEELEALPISTVLLGNDGSLFQTENRVTVRCLLSRRVDEHSGYGLESGYVANMYCPLTVVWQP